ncbi:tRNA (cytosine-5-)-methyltransferase ncl1 [Spiromyces aspiralis]|uniref:tRNA (Cytosine-5-)-methyltransferase ncl1 n=2 Tax=Spiromyces aspiralis TaxID=68401 RepID=A0ACC1HU90_9FUNG|nr:tRNA (cytosine-5-)-methyltransferase ncl1 [Spiromyces aspiralis]
MGHEGRRHEHRERHGRRKHGYSRDSTRRSNSPSAQRRQHRLQSEDRRLTLNRAYGPPVEAPPAWDIPEEARQYLYFDTRENDQLALFGGSFETKLKTIRRTGTGGKVLGLPAEYRIANYKEGPVEIVLERIVPPRIERYTEIRWKDIDRETVPFQPKRMSSLGQKYGASDESFIAIPEQMQQQGPEVTGTLSCGGEFDIGYAAESEKEGGGDYDRAIRHPEDVDAWLKQIDYQDVIYSAYARAGRTPAALNEVKLAIYEKAIDANPDNVELLSQYIKYCAKVLPMAELLTKWDGLLKRFGTDVELRLQYLDVCQSAFSAFDAMWMADVYSSTMYALRDQLAECGPNSGKKGECRGQPSGNAAVEFLLGNGFVTDAAFRSRVAEFQEYWEDVAPRIGEPGAHGWQFAAAPARSEDGDGAVDEDITSPPSPLQRPPVGKQEGDDLRAWAHSELEHSVVDIFSRRSRRMWTEADCDNPFSIVLFSDIEPYLFDVPPPLYQPVLVTLLGMFVQFLGIPMPLPPTSLVAAERDSFQVAFTPSTGDLWTSYGTFLIDSAKFWPQPPISLAWSYAMIDGVLMESPMRPAIDDAALASCFVFARNCYFMDNIIPVASAGGGDGARMGSPRLLDHLLLLCSTSFFMDPTMPKMSDAQCQFARNALSTLTSMKHLDDYTRRYLSLAWVAFEGTMSYKRGKKVVKRLLKAHPGDLILWNAYARYEDTYQHHSEASMDPELYILAKALVWAELRNRNPQGALAAAIALVNPELFKGGGSNLKQITPAQWLKARKHYYSAETSGGLFTSQPPVPEIIIAKATLRAVFAYLDRQDIVAADQEFAVALQLIQPHPESSNAAREGLLMDQCALHLYNNTNTKMYRPRLLRELLTTAVREFPQNTLFWLMLFLGENRVRIRNRVHDLISGALKSYPSPQLWLFAIYVELYQRSSFSSSAVRKLFAQAVDDDSARMCSLIWALHIAFEYRQGRQQEAKQAFYTAINQCVWQKDLLMLGFGLLGDVLTHKEKLELVRLMIEKNIWINSLPREAGTEERRDTRAPKFEVKKENPEFEKYYKGQGILDDNEWTQFMDTLVTTLPTSFRITGTRSMAAEIRDLITREYVPYVEEAEIDGEKVTPPAPLPWYPNNFGWHFEIPRIALKKSPALNKFHKFLVTEAEVGNISRQEAVSMIPPLLLDVRPHHLVLDMCAAPGSKTAQLLEAIHAEEQPDRLPSGFVVANDSDYKRACLLVHQTNRLNSPCLVVTNHSGERFPNVTYKDTEGRPAVIQFDRILCDVPCSGDGTMRKNPLIWKHWNVRDGINLHNIQTKILARSMYLLKEGGRLVYSTCSLNPMENEAVVADALNTFGDAIKLIDVSDQLPGLKRRLGMTSWKVMTRDGCFYQTYKELCDNKEPADSCKYTESLFAPANSEELGLEKCLRIYPHQQNTGGFFVAVFEKVKPIAKLERRRAKAGENRCEATTVQGEAPSVVPAKRAASPEADAQSQGNGEEGEPGKGECAVESPGGQVSRWRKFCPEEPQADPPLKESPFIFLDRDSESVQSIIKHFKISDKMQYNGFMVRDDKSFRTLYLVSDSVRAFLTQAGSKLRTVNTGIRMFDKNGLKDGSCPFRLTADGMPVIYPFMDLSLILNLTFQDLKVIITKVNPLVKDLSEGLQEQVKGLSVMGSVIARFDPTTEAAAAEREQEKELGRPLPRLYTQVLLPIWRGTASLSVHLGKNELRSMVIRVLGEQADIGKTKGPTDVEDTGSTPAATPATEKTSEEGGDTNVQATEA